MIKELDLIVRLNDDDNKNLKAGDIGTVVHCYKNGKVFEVEFATAEGKTIAVLTLTRGEIRPFDESEILHVRALKSIAA